MKLNLATSDEFFAAKIKNCSRKVIKQRGYEAPFQFMEGAIMGTWKAWKEEEINNLKNLCQLCVNWKDLKDKTTGVFQDRSWESVQKQAKRHPEWISHFLTKVITRAPGADNDKLRVEETSLSTEEEKLLKDLQKKSTTAKAISRTFKIAVEDVFTLIDKLRARGYDIEAAPESNGERQVFLRKEPVPGELYRLAPLSKNEIKILVISDPQLGLRTQQGDLLATAYKLGEQEGVYLAIAAGNISAGKPSPKRLGEYFLRTFEEQAEYIISHWPKAPFKTHFINGPTDLTFKTEKGQNIGYAIAQERNDLYYRGDKEAMFVVGKDARIAVVHVDGDYTDYTKSYALQGVTENYQELIDRVLENNYPPKLVLVGGTHSFVLSPARFPLSNKKKKRDIYSLNIPSLFGITPTQRGKRKRGGSPALGCWILTIKLDSEGNLKDVICDARSLTGYQIRDDYLEKVVIKPGLSSEQSKTLELLGEGHKTRGELCRILHRSTPYLQELIEGLVKEGYSIIFDVAEKRYKLEKNRKKEFGSISLDNMYKKKMKTVDFSDTHIGHKKSRWDLISEVYRVAEEEQVDEIHFCGDLVEGPGVKHGQAIKGEMDFSGADRQRDFTLSVWPKSQIPTKLILGSSHDFEYIELGGHNIAETFAQLATMKKVGDIEFIGEDTIWCRGYAEVNDVGVLLYHPSGGIPLGLTYRGQVNIERLMPILDEDFPARLLKVGHLHIAVFMHYKGMACLFVPCLQEQTQYLAAKGLFPWIGFWLTEAFLDDHENLTRVVLRYFSFEPRKKVQNNNHSKRTEHRSDSNVI